MSTTEAQSFLKYKAQTILPKIDSYSEKLREYFDLLKKFQRIRKYKEEKNIQKFVLALQPFRDPQELIEKIQGVRSIIEQIGTRLNEFLQEQKGYLIEGMFKCPVCVGAGRNHKTQYIREEGLQEVYQTESCSTCNGKGKITIPEEEKNILGYFLQLTNRIIVIVTEMLSFHKESDLEQIF